MMDNNSGPLSGITVLDATRVVAGPYCSMILADLGARVIKIENPLEPDYARDFPPLVGKDETSAFFAQYNRNKESITINFKSSSGRDLLKKLVKKADVFVENFRPGALDNLGIGYKNLKDENERLVFTAISGFGQDGEKSGRPSFDNTGQAESGLWSMNGYPDLPPVRVGTIIGDLAACFYAVIGTLAALREVETKGQGQFVDIAQVDSTLCLTESALVRYDVSGEEARPLGNQHTFARPYEQFSCKDGYVFFGGYNDKHWNQTLEVFGAQHLKADDGINTMQKRFQIDTYNQRIKPLIESWFINHTKEELENMLSDLVPLSPIKTIGEVITDSSLLARDMIVDLPVGDQLVKMFGNPIKLSNHKENKIEGAPQLGEHNYEIFSKMLGLTKKEIAILKESRAI